LIGVGIWALKKITQYFLLGKRIGGGITTSGIINKSNSECGNATQNKCDCTNATVDNVESTITRTVYAIRQGTL
jgi:hypothetical protein